VRTAGNPSGLEETLRRLANKTLPTVPMKFTTMETMLSRDMATPRFRTLLFALFAGLAVCLAMTGIYGVMAYTSGLRSNEFGLRMALGASRGSVLRLVLRQALILVSIGVAIGLAIALGVSRLFTSVLFEVKPTDPLTFIAVSLILIAVALVASYIPARRATKANPMVALRCE
jgi:putative ABC transport system permease protein